MREEKEKVRGEPGGHGGANHIRTPERHIPSTGGRAVKKAFEMCPVAVYRRMADTHAVIEAL